MRLAIDSSKGHTLSTHFHLSCQEQKPYPFPSHMRKTILGPLVLTKKKLMTSASALLFGDYCQLYLFSIYLFIHLSIFQWTVQLRYIVTVSFSRSDDCSGGKLIVTKRRWHYVYTILTELLILPELIILIYLSSSNEMEMLLLLIKNHFAYIFIYVFFSVFVFVIIYRSYRNLYTSALWDSNSIISSM